MEIANEDVELFSDDDSFQQSEPSEELSDALHSGGWVLLLLIFYFKQKCYYCFGQ